jgi:hypothetical protein
MADVKSGAMAGLSSIPCRYYAEGLVASLMQDRDYAEPHVQDGVREVTR